MSTLRFVSVFYPVKKKRFAPRRLPLGWSHQIPSWPRAQPTISQQCRASARAHRWWRAISRCDLRASTKPSDWEEDRPGSWAQPLRPGSRAGNSAHHEGASRGQCERGVEWSPLHRGWGWADYTSGTAGQVFQFSRAHSSHPLLPPPQPLSGSHPASPSAPYLYGASPAGLPSSSVAGAGVSLNSASEARTLPLPVDPVAPPRLLAPSPPPSPVASPGSLVPPALPWSCVDLPSPRDSSPLAAPHRSVPPSAPPGSSVAPAPLRISGSTPPPWSPEPSAPPWPPGSSASPWLVGSPSPPWAPHHSTIPPPPLVGPLESAAIPPPWLLPPLAPPWAIIMAVAWVLLCASCSGSLLSLPWLLLPSLPPWTLFTGPHPGVRPPPEPPP